MFLPQIMLNLFIINLFHSYVTCLYSYVIRVSLVCTCKLSVCTGMSFVCHLYVTCMYHTRMSSVRHSYALVCNGVLLVCHQYATRMYSYVIRM